MNVADILQVVGGGIAFLMALLAYRLLAQQGQLESPNPAVLKQNYYFMIFAFLLGVVAMIAQAANSRFNPVTTEEVSAKVESFEGKLEALNERLSEEEVDIPPSPVGQRLVLGTENQNIRIEGGRTQSARCPDGYAITGVAGTERVGGDIAGLALYRFDFVCSKIELVSDTK